MNDKTASTGDFVRKPRRRIAIGPPRPKYFESRDTDRLALMMVALMAEVSALRDRVDTHEALFDQDGTPTSVAVEAFRLGAPRAAMRDAQREAMMKRVFRVLLDEVEPDANAPAASSVVAPTEDR
jgi:hypothetical protein